MAKLSAELSDPRLYGFLSRLGRVEWSTKVWLPILGMICVLYRVSSICGYWNIYRIGGVNRTERCIMIKYWVSLYFPLSHNNASLACLFVLLWLMCKYLQFMANVTGVLAYTRNRSILISKCIEKCGFSAVKEVYAIKYSSWLIGHCFNSCDFDFLFIITFWAVGNTFIEMMNLFYIRGTVYKLLLLLLG